MGKRAHGEGTITKRDDGRWEARASVGYTPKGKPKRRSVYGRTQAEVREKLDKLKGQLATGTYSDAKLSVADYLGQWLKDKRHDLKPATFEAYRICVEQFIVPMVGRVRLDKLNPVQVKGLVNDVRAASSAATKGRTSGASRANKCRSVLHNALQEAVRLQLISRNPVEATDPVKEPHREMVLWQPEQAEQFLAVARKHRLFAFFYISLATGLRRGELMGLRWADVEGSLVHVKQALVKVGGELVLSTPKTLKGFRAVVISPDALEVLRLHRERQDAERAQLGSAWPSTLTVLKQEGEQVERVEVANTFVFTSEVGTPLNPDNLKRLRDALMDAAKVPRARLHDLRHQHASIAIMDGMDPKMLAERLGHSRASFTLDRYTHIFDSQRAQSGVSLSNWLSGKRTKPG